MMRGWDGAGRVPTLRHVGRVAHELVVKASMARLGHVIRV